MKKAPTFASGTSEGSPTSGASRLRRLHFICATIFSCSKFRAIVALLQAHNPGIRHGNERSRCVSCPRARASKIKTILELEADRRRNRPDGSRGISVSRPGSSIIGNGGIGDRSRRHLASPLGISRIRRRPQSDFFSESIREASHSVSPANERRPCECSGADGHADLVQLSGRRNLRGVWDGIAAVSKSWSASAIYERSRSDLSKRQRVPAKTAAKGI